jgi:hypothetical protein
MFKNHLAMVIPGHGPQVFPYALVIPNRHAPSFMSLNDEERGYVFEALDFLSSLKVYGKDLCVFEHGGGGGFNCQCIDHCHLHAVEVSWLTLMEEQFRSVSFPDKSQIASLVLDDASHRATPLSYLFLGKHCQGGKQLQGLGVRPRARQKQFFRVLLANCLAAKGGSAVWDWRQCGNQEMMVRLHQESQGG